MLTTVDDLAAMPAPAQRPASTAGDTELVMRIARGDAAALAEVFDRHSPRALRLARRILAGDAAAAEDAVQEAMLDVVRRAARPPQSDAAVPSWLLGIVANKCRMIARSSASRRRREAAAEVGPGASHPVGDESAEILRAVDELPEPYRSPLLLHLIEELPFADIGVALRRPEKTVRSQVSRGLERLREMLRRRGFFPATSAIAMVLAPPLAPPDAVLRQRILEAASRWRLAAPRRRAWRAAAAGGALLLIVGSGMAWRLRPEPLPPTPAIPIPVADRRAPADPPLDDPHAWTQPNSVNNFAGYVLFLAEGHGYRVVGTEEILADQRTLGELLPRVIVIGRDRVSDRDTLERVAGALGYAIAVKDRTIVVGRPEEVAQHPHGHWIAIDRPATRRLLDISVALSGRVASGLLPHGQVLGEWADYLQAGIDRLPYPSDRFHLIVVPTLRGARIGEVTGVVPANVADPSTAPDLNEEIVAFSDHGAREGASREGRASSVLTLLARVAAASGADVVIGAKEVTLAPAVGKPGAFRLAAGGAP